MESNDTVYTSIKICIAGIMLKRWKDTKGTLICILEVSISILRKMKVRQHVLFWGVNFCDFLIRLPLKVNRNVWVSECIFPDRIKTFQTSTSVGYFFRNTNLKKCSFMECSDIVWNSSNLVLRWRHWKIPWYNFLTLQHPAGNFSNYHPRMWVGNVFGHVCLSVCLCFCLFRL